MVHETDLQALRCEERLEFWEAEATDGPVPASVVDWETIGGWTLEGDAQAARAMCHRAARSPTRGAAGRALARLRAVVDALRQTEISGRRAERAVAETHEDSRTRCGG